MECVWLERRRCAG